MDMQTAALTTRAPFVCFPAVFPRARRYEPAHAPAVARVLAARLAREGRARGLLICPVRCSDTIDAFLAAASAAGLAATRARLAGGEGAERYEGGYARIDVRWADDAADVANEAAAALSRTHIQA
jgi:hypothetical protein